MRRFLYDGVGRDLANVDDLIELVDTEQQTGVETGLTVESLGIGSRLDKIYLPLATAVMGRVRAEALHKRTLASGLMFFYTDRRVVFEPGIETVQPKITPVANNFNDLTTVPDNTIPFSQDHMLWIAQSLLDYDFGVQHEQRERDKMTLTTSL